MIRSYQVRLIVAAADETPVYNEEGFPIIDTNKSLCLGSHFLDPKQTLTLSPKQAIICLDRAVCVGPPGLSVD